MFRPLRSLNEEEYEAAVISLLVRKRISLIAAHTNLDRTALSGSAAVAALLNLEKTRKEGAFLFLGELPFPLAAEALRGLTARLLGGPALLYGRRDALIRTLAVCGGACGDAYGQARAAGADALLTGEVRHHDAVAAAGSGFVLLSGGHFHTEAPMLPLLAAGLQKGMDELQYKVRIRVSESDPYVSFGLKEDE